jgi:hypothetical protein
MDIKKNLTNEKISKKFDNQFDLVNYSIQLAANMIHTGRSSRVKIDTENPALIIYEEILEGKDYFEEKKKMLEKEFFRSKTTEDKGNVLKAFSG